MSDGWTVVMVLTVTPVLLGAVKLGAYRARNLRERDRLNEERFR